MINMPRYSKQRLIDFSIQFFIKKGISEDNARYISELVVLTEAMGFTTHGLASLCEYDKELGLSIDPQAEPELVKDKGATALINGNRCMGHLAMKLAKEKALEKASMYGVAMVVVRNAGWIGALGVHLISLVKENLLAQIWAQSRGYPLCAPFGGIEAKLATNPVAIAFPTGMEPVLGDFATSAVSWGKLERMIEQGRKAEQAIFLDKFGNGTNDPSVVAEGGSILFLGGENFGYKGFTFALWCEAGAALAGVQNRNLKVPEQSFSLLVIDPDNFAGRDSYLAEMKAFILSLKESRPRPGKESVRLPGERSFQLLKAAEESGLQLDHKLLILLRDLSEKNKIPEFF